jgi:sigma54-dependent transcription regulator
MATNDSISGVRRVGPRHAEDGKSLAVEITLEQNRYLRICASPQLIWRLTFGQKLSNVLLRSPTAAARGRVPAGHAIRVGG